MRVASLAVALTLAISMPSLAQDREQTLADIRQELTVLFVEVQKLKREMSTTSTPQVNLGAGSVLDRVGAMEAELQRLTALAERLENRVDRIVTDGTNRIGDLEFRLVELEGGDVSALGETTTLGGGSLPAGTGTQTGAAQTGPTTELAVGEEADFQAATTALDAGEFQKAATLFAGFNDAYPGSPLAAQAELKRGKALDGLGDTREAARAYLASFSADMQGPSAGAALFELGAALGRLGQSEQACITLAEVGVRFPSDPASAQAREEMTKLGCT